MFKFQLKINGVTHARFALQSDAEMFAETFLAAYPNTVITIEDRRTIYRQWN